MAQERDAYNKKQPVKDYHSILGKLTTDRAKIDSITRWVRNGNYHVTIVKKGSIKSGSSTYNVPADSIEFYYWKMKEKANSQNN